MVLPLHGKHGTQFFRSIGTGIEQCHVRCNLARHHFEQVDPTSVLVRHGLEAEHGRFATFIHQHGAGFFTPGDCHFQAFGPLEVIRDEFHQVGHVHIGIG